MFLPLDGATETAKLSRSRAAVCWPLEARRGCNAEHQSLLDVFQVFSCGLAGCCIVEHRQHPAATTAAAVAAVMLLPTSKLLCPSLEPQHAAQVAAAS